MGQNIWRLNIDVSLKYEYRHYPTDSKSSINPKLDKYKEHNTHIFLITTTEK